MALPGWDGREGLRKGREGVKGKRKGMLRE